MSSQAGPAERAAASRAAQGLPPTVTDPAVLARVAALIRSARTAPMREHVRDGP